MKNNAKVTDLNSSVPYYNTAFIDSLYAYNWQSHNKEKNFKIVLQLYERYDEKRKKEHN